RDEHFHGFLQYLSRDGMLHFGDDLFRRITEVIGGDDRQPAGSENVLALLDVGAFETHDQRNAQIYLARGFNNALGDDVAAHDSAEDVDQDALHRRVTQNDFERGGDLLLGRAAADVEEIRRLAALQLDDVHRRHGETGAVDHAADIAVQFDVGEVVFRCLDLHRLFFGEVAQLLELGMAELGIVVEADLGVEHQELTLVRDRERIDLDLR